MSDYEPLKRVCVEGRECEVMHAYLYANEDFYDIWLVDIETELFTHTCTESDSGLSCAEQQRLVHERYVDVLAEAGVVIPTGEVFDTECHGRLHLCDVPVRERISFRESAEAPEHHRDPESLLHHAERDLDDRDLGDEIEL